MLADGFTDVLTHSNLNLILFFKVVKVNDQKRNSGRIVSMSPRIKKADDMWALRPAV
jgi:hypothetical protein